MAPMGNNKTITVIAEASTYAHQARATYDSVNQEKWTFLNGEWPEWQRQCNQST